jgi:hypothetical protein
MVQNNDISVPNSLFNQVKEYTCEICGHTFSTAQSLAAHIDSEHPELEQPEIFIIIKFPLDLLNLFRYCGTLSIVCIIIHSFQPSTQYFEVI